MVDCTMKQHFGESSETLSPYRWPAHMAEQMADNIQEEVRSSLSQSRLVPQTSYIHLVRKDDIVEFQKPLGSGAFSQVTAVVCKDGRRYACKNIKQKLMEKPAQFKIAASELACEAHMLASFDHPNILKIRGWSYNGIASFSEGFHNSFFLLLDVLDETLDQRIDNWRVQELTHVDDQSIYMRKLQIMSEIASALGYLHDQGVIFRDLKPNNIGFLGGRVQLFDFGLSRELPALNPAVPFEMSGKVGTLRYMANEVALHLPYNLSADIFSFAMVSFEMLSLQKPYDGWTRDMHTSLACERGLRPDTSNCLWPIPLDMCLLLERAWHSDPSQRPSVDQIFAQLEAMKDAHFLLLESQHLQQLQVAHHLEAQRRAQEEALARAIFIENYHSAPSPPMKLKRSLSSDSMETIETTSLSGESIGDRKSVV